MNDAFRLQREMRNVRREALERGVLATLDVSSTKVTCIVLRFDGPDWLWEKHDHPNTGTSSFHVIGTATVRTKDLHPESLEGLADVERCIRAAIAGAQKMANVRIDHVYVGFSSIPVESLILQGRTEVQHGLADRNDAGAALGSCQMPDNKDVLPLHAMPVNFMLYPMSHVRGAADRHWLKVDLHLLQADRIAVENLLSAVRRCDVEIAGLTCSALTSGLSCLSEDELHNGATIIDMGAKTTTISSFLKGRLIGTTTIPVGGLDITQAISEAFDVEMEHAERIKTFYGGLEIYRGDENEVIELGDAAGKWDRKRRTATREELVSIIHPIMVKVLNRAFQHIREKGMNELYDAHIVLTGGCSQMDGLKMTVEEISRKEVRIGRPMRIQGLPQAVAGAGFASAVGLCIAAAYPQDEIWDYEVPIKSDFFRSLLESWRWVKKNW